MRGTQIGGCFKSLRVAFEVSCDAFGLEAALADDAFGCGRFSG
jgi:hypothetical protein